MRLAIVCINRFGGTLKYGSRLADALVECVPVEMIVSADADTELLPRRAPRWPIKTGTTGWQNLCNTANPLRHRAVLRHVQQFQPDVVLFPIEHAWNPILQAFLPNCAVVQTIHDPVRHSGEASLIYDLVRHLALQRADRVVVLTKKFQAAFAAYGVPPERVDVIPHGAFEFDERDLGGQPFPPPPGRQNILFAGRINRYKGIEVLLKAFALVRAARPAATLAIVGAGELDDYQPLLAAASGVTVVNRYVSERELAEYHAACDFVVAPYLDASQSGVAALALANGRTIVASRIGGLVEQVEDGVTGLLVEPGDVVALRDALLQLLDNPERVRTMAATAQARYAARFGWPAIAQQTIRTCERACAEHQTVAGITRARGLIRRLRRAIRSLRHERRRSRPSSNVP